MKDKIKSSSSPYDPEEFENRTCPYCKEYENAESYRPGARRRRRNKVSLKTHISKEHPEKDISGEYGDLTA